MKQMTITAQMVTYRMVYQNSLHITYEMQYFKNNDFQIALQTIYVYLYLLVWIVDCKQKHKYVVCWLCWLLIIEKMLIFFQHALSLSKPNKIKHYH